LETFYDAIRAWNELIHREENVYAKRLEPGTALIFDNWRVFHARIGITTGKRRMCGAYFDRDDFYSFLTINNSKDQVELFNSL
jgi:trimethyllysine dioxygenase